MTAVASLANFERLAAELAEECSHLSQPIQVNALSPDSKSQILDLSNRLSWLVKTPHEFLHDYVSTHWEQGALYALLQSTVPQILCNSGAANLDTLANESGLPHDKLLRILRTVSCLGIVEETSHEEFTSTPLLDELVNDPEFRAWIEFQLFEPTVASAHLGEVLKEPQNGYEDGKSAFKQAWGMEMYDWHGANESKGQRFRKAMKGVSQTLDPADSLFRQWFAARNPDDRKHFVEIWTRYGNTAQAVEEQHPDYTFEVRSGQEAPSNAQPAEDANTVAAYVVRNILWNLTDDDAVKVIRTFLPVLERSTSAVLLVCDGVSPARGQFSPLSELPYRRRDITMMTMHNAKQRTNDEWLALFKAACPRLEVTATFECSEHVYKGLYELRYSEEEETK